jgi:hypothetical protein
VATEPPLNLRADLEELSRSLRREQAEWATALSFLLEATLFWSQNQRPRTVELLATAARKCRETDMRLYEAAALRRLGRIRGGTTGNDELAAGDRLMLERGVKDLERMTATLAPGFRLVD